MKLGSSETFFFRKKYEFFLGAVFMLKIICFETIVGLLL